MEAQESLQLALQVENEVLRVNEVRCGPPDIKNVFKPGKAQNCLNQGVYLLKLENGKFYVGKSFDVQKRFDLHKQGLGSTWTKLHKPIEILFVKPITGPFEETNVTKDMMRQYGIENVRGGPFCEIELDKKTKDILIREIGTIENTCYNCNAKDHVSKMCPQKYCYQCKIIGHIKENCPNKIVCNVCKQVGHIQKDCPKIACYNCKKFGHYAANCPLKNK